MPATGHSRRALLLLPFASRLWAAGAEQQVFDLFEVLASRLSDGNVRGAMDCFDKSMPGYESFQANISGLLTQSEVQSSLDFVSNEGTDAVRTVAIDWLLQTKARYDTGAVTRRREIVKCRLEKIGRRWKIFTLAPQSFFAPPQVSR
jgi:hypothetical protein